MATNRPRKQSTRKTTGTKASSRGARTAAKKTTGTTAKKATRASGSSSNSSASNGSSSSDSLRMKVVTSAVGAVVGGAALGVANRLVNRHSRPKLLGVRIPDELEHVDVRRLAKGVDLKSLIRHIGDFAEQVEARSEDVRSLSAQAKRLSRRIS